MKIYPEKPRSSNIADELIVFLAQELLEFRPNVASAKSCDVSSKLTKQGIETSTRKLFAKAAEEFRAALEQNPANFAARFALARLLNEQFKKPNEALFTLGYASGIAPSEEARIWCLNYQGVILGQLGQWDAAMRIFESIVKSGSADPTVFFNYAESLAVLNHDALALDYLVTSLDNQKNTNRLTRMYSDLDQNPNWSVVRSNPEVTKGLERNKWRLEATAGMFDFDQEFDEVATASMPQRSWISISKVVVASVLLAVILVLSFNKFAPTSINASSTQSIEKGERGYTTILQPSRALSTPKSSALSIVSYLLEEPAKTDAAKFPLVSAGTKEGIGHAHESIDANTLQICHAISDDEFVANAGIGHTPA